MKDKLYSQNYFGYDVLGQKFGRLTVTKIFARVKGSSSTTIEYLCHCDCGNDIVVTRRYLKSKRFHSCGCLLLERKQHCLENRTKKYMGLIGQRVGRLIVKEIIPREKDENGFYKRDDTGKLLPIKYLCHCDCGNDIVVERGALLQQSTKSCGCLSKSSKRGRPRLTPCSHQKEKCSTKRKCCCWNCPPKIWEKCPNHCPVNPAQCKEYRD